MQDHWLTVPGVRGCGSRKQKALYMCVGMSPFGAPIEYFVLDPARPFKGDAFRAPMILEREDKPNDVLIWIGKEYYPFVPDFIAEARRMGISRRVPHNFPAGQLSRGSRMILVHARVIPTWGYLVDRKSDWCKHPHTDHECTYNLWPLSLLDSCEGHEVRNWDTVHTPSCTYHVGRKVTTHGNSNPIYGYGAFAAFYITHYEWVDRDNTCPEDVVTRVRESGLDLEVVRE